MKKHQELLKYLSSYLNININKWNAGLNMYTGTSGNSIFNGSIQGIWIQAGDDLEGNPHGNPGANINSNNRRIRLSVGEGIHYYFKISDARNIVCSSVVKKLREYFRSTRCL